MICPWSVLQACFLKSHLSIGNLGVLIWAIILFLLIGKHSLSSSNNHSFLFPQSLAKATKREKYQSAFYTHLNSVWSLIYDKLKKSRGKNASYILSPTRINIPNNLNGIKNCILSLNLDENDKMKVDGCQYTLHSSLFLFSFE